MTDNTQAKLEDILDTLAEKSADSDSRLGYVDAYVFAQEAKQALTSLIKELVADAKPMTTSVNVIETYLQNGMPQKAAEHHGRNHAIDQYEQNLLKALEETEQ